VIDGIVVLCLYLPNGNPTPGPKFDYKLRWSERLHAYADERRLQRHADRAQGLQAGAVAGRVDPSGGQTYICYMNQGWAEAIRFLHPDERIAFWKYFRNSLARDAGLRIDHFLLGPTLRDRLTEPGVDAGPIIELRFVITRKRTGDESHGPSFTIDA
jgi:exodeoxyribonuclease-3